MVWILEPDLQTKGDYVDSAHFGMIPLTSVKPESVKSAIDASAGPGPFGQEYYDQP